MFEDIIKRYFDNDLLFLCFKFKDRFKCSPDNVDDLFDGLDYEGADADVKRLASFLASQGDKN